MGISDNKSIPTRIEPIRHATAEPPNDNKAVLAAEL